MVYVWWLDDLRHEYDTAHLANSVGAAVGGGRSEMPLWSEVRDDFDVRINAAPDGVDGSDESVILRALGLGAR